MYLSDFRDTSVDLLATEVSYLLYLCSLSTYSVVVIHCCYRYCIYYLVDLLTTELYTVVIALTESSLGSLGLGQNPNHP